MMIAIYESNSGRITEVHTYQVPVVDDDGFPDGWNEVWETYTFDNKYTNEFTTRTFVEKVTLDLFLKIDNNRLKIYLDFYPQNFLSRLYI